MFFKTIYETFRKIVWFLFRTTSYDVFCILVVAKHDMFYAYAYRHASIIGYHYHTAIPYLASSVPYMTEPRIT